MFRVGLRCEAELGPGEDDTDEGGQRASQGTTAIIWARPSLASLLAEVSCGDWNHRVRSGMRHSRLTPS